MANLASTIALIITYRNKDFTFRTAKTKVILIHIPRERNDRVIRVQWYNVIQYDTLIHIHWNETGNDDLAAWSPVVFARNICIWIRSISSRSSTLSKDAFKPSCRHFCGTHNTPELGDGWWWMMWQTSLFYGCVPYTTQFDSSICTHILVKSLCSSPFAATTSRFSWGPPAF